MAKVKLTNDVKISEESLSMTIDPSNKIADLDSTTVHDGYTAPQDCWVILTPVTANDETILAIDGVQVFRQWTSSTCYNIVPVFLHEGQIVSRYSGHGVNRVNVFGCK